MRKTKGKSYKCRWLCFFLAVCVAVSALAGCAAQKEEKQAESSLPKITVGYDVYPPFGYIGPDGVPTGIDMDLAVEAFHRMGYEPEFVAIEWEDKKTLVESGEIDCIWSSFSMDGREEEYNWAGPYMMSRQVVAVMPESDIYTLQDLGGKRIALQTTTKPEEILLSGTDPRIPEIGAVLSLQNRELIYPMLSKGYADAVAAHETSLKKYMEDYNVQYRILEEPLLTVGLGVAFANSDTRGLEKTLYETLNEMRKEGVEAEIIGRYLENPESYLEGLPNA